MIEDPFSAAKQCWDTGWSMGFPHKKIKTPAKAAFQAILKFWCEENIS